MQNGFVWMYLWIWWMGYSDKETKEQNGAMPDDDSDDKEMKRFAVSHSISFKKRYWMLDSIWKLKYGRLKLLPIKIELRQIIYLYWMIKGEKDDIM